MNKYAGWRGRSLHVWRVTGSWPLPLWPQARSAGGSREFSETDSEGTGFEGAGCSLSSPGRGCLENTEEFHVRLGKCMEDAAHEGTFQELGK